MVDEKTASLTQQYTKSAKLVTQNAYMMFSNKAGPFQEKATMHMNHLFNDTFRDVCAAFVLKYNGKNSWCTTTICHVEQIDENKFAFVRRLENVMSSQPLYERIIVDREKMELKGYTFEKKEDTDYSEHFVYTESADKKSVAYDMYLFRDPGLKRILRYRMFNWGIGSLQKIIDTKHKLVAQKLKAAELLKTKKEELKAKKDALKGQAS